jgi:hypothetical protein
MTARRRQPAGLVRRRHDQPGLRQREAGEHADREQRDQRQGVAADRDQEHPGPGGRARMPEPNTPSPRTDSVSCRAPPQLPGRWSRWRARSRLSTTSPADSLSGGSRC